MATNQCNVVEAQAACAFRFNLTALNILSMTTATLNTSEAHGFVGNKMLLTILPEEVDQILRQDFNSIIVDVREAKDFIRGHVPGAINLPEGNWSKISGLQYDVTMIVYCYSNTCPLGLQTISEFARHGYSAVEMEGGFDAWKENNLPVEF
jgi:rhodanese-related sulfurtransferase